MPLIINDLQSSILAPSRVGEDFFQASTVLTSLAGLPLECKVVSLDNPGRSDGLGILWRQTPPLFFPFVGACKGEAGRP